MRKFFEKYGKPTWYVDRPVSYTHLMQVRYNNFYEGVGYYKKNFFCPGELKDKRVFLRFEGVGACSEAVSYTHLDVYKRQVV